MGEIIRLPWGVSRVGAATLDLLEDEERRCLDLSILQISVLRQMAYPWALLPSRLVEDHGEYQEIIEMPVAYLEALEELEILLSGAYDGPKEGCPMGEVYVDRGDISSMDFAIGDGLVADAAWHPLNLNWIVYDDYATQIKIRANIQAATGLMLLCRAFGYENTGNLAALYSQAAYGVIEKEFWLPLPNGRFFSYYLSSGITVAAIAVLGWWKPAE